MTRSESEAVAKFEKAGFELAEYGAFEVFLGVAIFHPEEVKDVEIAKDEIGKITDRWKHFLQSHRRLMKESTDGRGGRDRRSWAPFLRAIG